MRVAYIELQFIETKTIYSSVHTSTKCTESFRKIEQYVNKEDTKYCD